MLGILAQIQRKRQPPRRKHHESLHRAFFLQLLAQKSTLHNAEDVSFGEGVSTVSMNTFSGWMNDLMFDIDLSLRETMIALLYVRRFDGRFGGSGYFQLDRYVLGAIMLSFSDYTRVVSLSRYIGCRPQWLQSCSRNLSETINVAIYAKDWADWRQEMAETVGKIKSAKIWRSENQCLSINYVAPDWYWPDSLMLPGSALEPGSA